MKRFVSLVLAATVMSMSCVSAAAYVLGEFVGGWDQDVGMGTHYYNNVFESAQNGVGKQTEYYYEYTPNENAVPVVVNGSQIYGKRTINQAADYMLSAGQNPLMGINADYFSFKTGIPMGHTIIDGSIVTKDGTGMNAVGFRKDGTAFISWLQMMTTIRSENGQAEVDNINKWCQPGMTSMYMMSDFFGEDTKTSSECTFVILSPVSGTLKIGGDEFKLRVDERFSYEGAIAIPEGKYVLAMDNSTGNAASLAFLNSLNSGDEVSICCTSVYDSALWETAEYGIGSIGGRLVENGIAKTNFEAGANPRTAVGIKADGTVIFYVIDGRQSGHSYGVQLKTLAQRMAELGCVDAINLDGGGSSVIGGVFNNDSNFIVLNSPSDGTVRYCANYLFLNVVNYVPPEAQQPSADKETGLVMSKPKDNNFLSGAYYNPAVKVFDSSGAEIESAQVSFSVQTTESAAAEVTDDGMYHVSGHGSVTVRAAYKNESDEYTFYVFETPDDILLYDGEKEIKSITVHEGEKLTVDLNAEAFLNSARLSAQDACFSWSVTGGVGSIDGNGVFELNSKKAGKGEITVSAGGYTERFPVVIKERERFADISGHWAEQYIEQLRAGGVLNGSYYDGKLYFYPDDSMTRAQFAVLMCAYLGIDTDDYADAEYPFSDRGRFADWMKNSINAAAALGIMNGRTDGSFSPNDSITRAEAAAVTARAAGAAGDGGAENFADAGDIPEWAAAGVGYLVQRGAVSGYPDNTFRPSNNVSRAEAAAIICRLGG